MIAMVSNMSGLQFSDPRSSARKCNRCAVLCSAAVALFFGVFLPLGASAQSSLAEQAVQPAQSDEHPVMQSVKFVAGGVLGLAIHESGHLAFDVLFDADQNINKVTFGPFPFF